MRRIFRGHPGLLDPHYYSQLSRSQPSNKNILFPLEQLKYLLSVKDYDAVIKNPELFKKAFFLTAGQRDPDPFLSIREKDDQLHVELSCGLFTVLPKIIELIRQFIEKTLEEKKSKATIYLLKDSPKIYFTEKLDSEIILENVSEKFSKHFYFNSVEPSLSDFAKSIGLTYSESICKQEIRHFADVMHRETVTGKAICFEFSEEAGFIYPIPPVKITDTSANELQKGLYDLYQEQQMCDYTLIAQGTGEIALHSNVLLVRGGKYFKDLMTNGMKESFEKQTRLDCSLGTLKIFIDFLYLGSCVFEPESFFKGDNGSHVFELLALADYCQNETLINCCTNLISLLVDQKDCETIKNLAELYNNDHLRRLHEHYLLLLDPNPIRA